MKQDFSADRQDWDFQNTVGNRWFKGAHAASVALILCFFLSAPIIGFVAFAVGLICLVMDFRKHWNADWAVLNSERLKSKPLTVWEKCKHLGAVFFAKHNRTNVAKGFATPLLLAVTVGLLFVASGGTAYFVLMGLALFSMLVITAASLFETFYPKSFMPVRRFEGLATRMAKMAGNFRLAKHNNDAVKPGTLSVSNQDSLGNFGPNVKFLIISQQLGLARKDTLSAGETTQQTALGWGEDRVEVTPSQDQWTVVDTNASASSSVIGSRSSVTSLRLFQHSATVDNATYLVQQLEAGVEEGSHRLFEMTAG